MTDNTVLNFAHFTHTGTHRAENQDAVLCAPQQGFWVVAQGKRVSINP